MLHLIKFIKKYLPEYKNHKIAAISPCVAKKIEFIDTGLGDYNVGISSIENYLSKNKINLANFPKTDFDSPPAERAVLFSNPGGLLNTLKRWIPSITKKTRKIEGSKTIYPYLKKFPQIIKQKKAPLIIDCLNCKLGCNGGSLTNLQKSSPDETEYWIEKRNKSAQKIYKPTKLDNTTKSKNKIENVINFYWTKNLYTRKYINKKKNNFIKKPSAKERVELFSQMHKYCEEDIKNCSSCGYFSCEDMATAIYNNINRPENCHFYLSKETSLSNNKIIKQEQRLRNILETSLEGFIQVDNNFVVQKVNPSMCTILQKKESELISKSMYSLATPKTKKTLKEQQKIRAKGITSSFFGELYKKNGDITICLFNSTPLYNENKVKIGSFSMVSDVTKLHNTLEELDKTNKELEERVKSRTYKLIQAEKLASLGHLVAGVAHEINNPLSFIKANSCIIAEDLTELENNTKKTKPDNKTMKNINNLLNINLNGINRISKITQTLKRYARPNIEIHSKSDINQGIKDTLLLVQNQIKHKINLHEKYQSIPLINCNIGHLNQVFMNILLNAIQAPKVTDIWINTIQIKNEIFIEFKDNGIGIKPENINNIFTPFYTSKDKGSGLGLSISYRIIKDHKGEMTVKSSQEKGTTMTISLPIN